MNESLGELEHRDVEPFVFRLLPQAVPPDGSLAWRELEVRPDGSFGYWIAWQALLELAAVECAKSFGSHLGEGLADIAIQKLKESLFGSGSQSDFESQVIRRLDVIEGKLDQLINYFKKEFPAVYAGLAAAANAEVTAKALKTEMVAVDGWRKTYLKTRDDDDAVELRRACEGAWKLGNQLLMYGPGHYSAGLHSLGVWMSGMSLLLRSPGGYKKHAELVKSWARSYVGLLRPFLDPSNPSSLTFAEINGQKALDKAKEVHATLPANVWNVAYLNYEEGDKALWQAYFTAFFWDGEKWDGSQDRSPRFFPKGRNPTNAEFEASIPNTKVMPWWIFKKSGYGKEPPDLNFSPDPHVCYVELRDYARAQGRIALTYQPVLDELRSHIASCRHLLTACEKLAEI